MFLITTRNFPPDLGGMQMLMGGLSNNLLNYGPVKIFAEKPGVIFSRERLTGLVGPGTGQRTVDVQVNRLRYKIEPDQKLPRYLQTVRGRGYVLRSD